MSKKILILEPSKTVQTLIFEKIRENNEIEVSFSENGLNLLSKLSELSKVSKNSELSEKDSVKAIFINMKAANPKSMELSRFLKSTDRFKRIPLALYTTGDFPFTQFYAKNSGTDIFFRFEEADFAEKITKMLSLAENENRAVPVQNDTLKNALTAHTFSMLRHISSIKQVVFDSLNLLAEFSESPALALYFVSENKPRIFFMAAENLSKQEIMDFLKVGSMDFENALNDTSVADTKPKRLKDKKNLERFRTNEVPLSSYKTIPLLSGEKKQFGTIHLVKEGNFTTAQLDLLTFSAKRISLLLENAIMVEQKNAVEARLKKAFSRFVPAQIIDELVSEAERTDRVAVGEKRNVAILFSDIRSFTNISERNKPEVIVAFLNRYFTIMCTVIKKHGGTVDKFIGDAIMAEFGVPVSYEDNSRRAVAAAYEMREALKTVPLGDLILPEGMNFSIGIGIHYGDAIVGSIGSNDKTDYSVIGDTVNLASRLEGLTKTYGSMILVSGAVKDDISESERKAGAAKSKQNAESNFVFRHLDDVKVKGKATAVSIYAIDKSESDFSPTYRDSYAKGFSLYKQGIWKLAREYFEKAKSEAIDDKAAKLMLARCEEFCKNPPEHWDGAIAFSTK